MGGQISSGLNARSQLRFLDLYCGPGLYENGEPSTPIEILRQIRKKPKLSIQAIFNDHDIQHINTLKSNIQRDLDLAELHPAPIFYQERVEKLAPRLIAECKENTLLFADPFGYKGISADWLTTFLRGRKNDAILFFNYRRINPAINNRVFNDLINSLFGKQTAEQLRNTLTNVGSEQREELIVQTMINVLEKCALCTKPFRFGSSTASRTSHYIFIASKHPLGIQLGKAILAKESDDAPGGVASFENDPLSGGQQSLAFGLASDDLKTILMQDFVGRSLSQKDLRNEHHMKSSQLPFEPKHYRTALLELEASGHILCSPPEGKRSHREGRPTMNDEVIITFPGDD